ncbi:hypothetical protein PAPYR_8491 [Paratrimastix pyriformis]|uniref:F-box domain-containing protein n=1 Tax=Paratrimastix pyriformis TaxID=342808 RepID=A0ABQ8UAH2_9EUKA|nr:hypothetical protein PAPYR_8491 [Paratrimastix pyriformis]
MTESKRNKSLFIESVPELLSLPDELLAYIGSTISSVEFYCTLIAVCHRFRILVRGTVHTLSFDDEDAAKKDFILSLARVPSAETMTALLQPCKQLISLVLSPRRAVFGCGREKAPFGGWIDASFGHLGETLRTLHIPDVEGFSREALIHLLSLLPELTDLELRGRSPVMCTPPLVQTICATCPKLESLGLFMPLSGSFEDLTVLGPCTTLRTLRLTKVPFGKGLEALIAALPRLTTLELLEVCDLSSVVNIPPGFSTLLTPCNVGPFPVCLDAAPLAALEAPWPIVNPSDDLEGWRRLSCWTPTLRSLRLTEMNAPSLEALGVLLPNLEEVDIHRLTRLTLITRGPISALPRLDVASSTLRSLTLLLPVQDEFRVVCPNLDQLTLPQFAGALVLRTPSLRRLEGLDPRCRLDWGPDGQLGPSGLGALTWLQLRSAEEAGWLGSLLLWGCPRLTHLGGCLLRRPETVRIVLEQAACLQDAEDIQIRLASPVASLSLQPQPALRSLEVTVLEGITNQLDIASPALRSFSLAAESLVHLALNCPRLSGLDLPKASALRTVVLPEGGAALRRLHLGMVPRLEADFVAPRALVCLRAAGVLSVMLEAWLLNGLRDGAFGRLRALEMCLREDIALTLVCPQLAYLRPEGCTEGPPVDLTRCPSLETIAVEPAYGSTTRAAQFDLPDPCPRLLQLPHCENPEQRRARQMQYPGVIIADQGLDEALSEEDGSDQWSEPPTPKPESEPEPDWELDDEGDGEEAAGGLPGGMRPPAEEDEDADPG